MSRPIHLIVLQSVLRAAASGSASQPVYGVVRLTESLVLVTSAVPADGSVRRIGVLGDSSAGEGRVVQLVVDGVSIALALEPDVPLPASTEIVDAQAALDSRRLDLVPRAGLAGKCVLLAGAGSVGSQVGVLLAQAGVGRFLVLDNDTFSASNVSRHAAGILHLGRRKAQVVAEVLAERCVKADGHDVDIAALADRELDALVAQSDIVVSSLDSAAAQFVINESCVRTKTVGIFPGAYERACGGEIVVYRPGLTPCLVCAVGFRAGQQLVAEPAERRQAYQDADATRLDAEPGLGADIAYLAAVTAAYTLALLDPAGSRAALVDADRSFTLLHGGSTPRAEYATLFAGPFDMLTARIRRPEPCPVCGWTDGEVRR